MERDTRCDFPVLIYHTSSDDPKKCTARKMERYGLAKLIKDERRIPHGMIVLDPDAPQALSKADMKYVHSRGILAVDCSWEEVDELFPHLIRRRHLRPRALPYMLATNPVNFGKPFILSTLEAIAASLYILGCRERAKKYLGLYTWGQHFLEVNGEPLEEYSRAENSEEVVEIQMQYINSQPLKD